MSGLAEAPLLEECEDHAMHRESLVTLPAALTAPGIGAGARFVMGVDGGATKTLAAVLDLREHTLHLGHGGSSNPDAVGAPIATT